MANPHQFVMLCYLSQCSFECLLCLIFLTKAISQNTFILRKFGHRAELKKNQTTKNQRELATVLSQMSGRFLKNIILIVINNKGNVFSHHVIQQVLEITTQQKKPKTICHQEAASVGLSHHWAQTELFPAGNTHFKESLLSNPPKIYIATCR